MEKTDEQVAAEVATEKADLGMPADETNNDEPQGTEVVIPKEEVKPADEKTDETKPAPTTEESTDDKKPERFDFKEYKKTLRSEMQKDYDDKLAKLEEEYKKGKPNEVKTEDLEADIEALSKELDFDKEKTKRIIEVARKGLEISPEDREYIAKAKEREKQLLDREEELNQEKIFNSEWEDTLKSLKTQFPNATDEQLKVARDQMEELAFNEDNHLKEMDYILFKNKKIFDDILFSPKQKTFETGRVHDDSDSSDIPAPTAENLADMTPAQFEAYEKRLDSQHSETPREKLRITTRDDRGRMTDRFE